MTTPTNREDIDEILKDLQVKSFHAGKLGSDRKYGLNRAEAKAKLENLIIAERIDELSPWQAEVNNPDLLLLIEERLATLKKQQEKYER